MEFDNSKPIYLQIIDSIKKQLIRGELKPGDKILSQREFAQSLKVNPNTVQRAYREMERVCLVETIRGQGTFVCERKGMLEEIQDEMADRILRNFLQEMYSLGFEKDKIIELVAKWQKQMEEERK
ncbi:MAG: GntR family transcriptional regulator [Thermotaleaceae bacterium]